MMMIIIIITTINYYCNVAQEEMTIMLLLSLIKPFLRNKTDIDSTFSGFQRCH